MSGTLTGQLLVSSPMLDDPNFARTVVALLQHDEDGALGVVLNRPSTSSVGEHLPEWESVAADPALVFVGGPVSPEVAIGLARLESDVSPIPGVSVVDLSDAPHASIQIRVFSGYSGWSPGQLEFELNEEAWLLTPAIAADVFTDRPDLLWGRAVRRVDADLGVIATFPLDPELN